MSDVFSHKEISSWDGFLDHVSDQNDAWIYRGQPRDWRLSTSLERTLNAWDIDLSDANAIETQLVRDFRRRFRHTNLKSVWGSLAYCLAEMQHHGAPTRLLDFTYSPYVAARFAIQGEYSSPVVWCINANWCNREARTLVGEQRFLARQVDDTRAEDASFRSLYIDNSNEKFVMPENPLQLNERLTIQRGVFLCPGNINMSLVENISAMNGFNEEKNIVKLNLSLSEDERAKFASELDKMNMTSAVLFPGLDGFARSLHETIHRQRRLAKFRTGQSDVVMADDD